MLPIYGARLFDCRRPSFGPIDQGPAPQDMVVGAGDELRIRIWGQINFSANLRVSREGEIYLPKAGAVHVAGLAFSAVAGHLRTALERVYRNFELSVDHGRDSLHPDLCDRHGAAAGRVHGKRAQHAGECGLFRGRPFRHRFHAPRRVEARGQGAGGLRSLCAAGEGDKTGDVQLQPGDVLLYSRRGAAGSAAGQRAAWPRIYELRGEESIEELLNTAGGRTAIASGGRISVERIEDHARRRAFELKCRCGGPGDLLADGDIVRIDPIVSSYRDTVTLRGSVANPGRFLWHQGMSLSELMPDKDSLLSRDYWWQRTQLGLPAPQLGLQPSQLALPTSQPGMSATQPGVSATQMALLAGQQSQQDKLSAVASPGAQTNWNQADIERLDPATMTTRLIPFQLGKLVLDHDMSQDLDLQPGDVVTIFAQQSVPPPIMEQTVYVELDGEFAHPGIYSVTPGETLRSVVARAGGLTDRAYLYGLNFTRTSTQAAEQQHLNEYADRIEHQMQRNGLGLVNAPSGSGQQSGTVSGQQVGALNQSLLARIRQVRASGRVVLAMSPESKGLNALPDMHLEDGDRLVVPFVPETIQAVGAVFNPHAFLASRNARVGEYLHLAGGANREADSRHMFVLRADGSVVGRGMGRSVFDSDFKKLRLYPGDAIVVPEKEIHPSTLNQLMAWSQFMSQLSLNALAVNAIK